MAVQNFLSGGYYGKLGATVGQRWKNKRTIRTYVIPHNPKTEIQQANRSRFANAVSYAQMGLQMNYYATCFESTSITGWNYRMSVARGLRSAGFSDLDLIPLYPLDFTPPTLVSEISISGVSGDKHITFAVPELTGETDRVFSMMFALYTQAGVYQGLKLYLGYYYASNPGYLECDVDSVSEINENCFVRMVTNDDTDSSTDMIASAKLQVQAGSIDIREFDTSIVSLTKDTTGITICFAEPWLDSPTANSIDLTVHCVVNGGLVDIPLSGGVLSSVNGYCGITVPYTTSYNSDLPAFPSGSYVSVSTVSFCGATWQYTASNITVSYSDSDLARTLTRSFSYDASSTSAIAFSIPFAGSVSDQSITAYLYCGGRLSIGDEVQQTFALSTDGSNLTFTCTGEYAYYPMLNDANYVGLSSFSIVSNGVTYSHGSEEVIINNAIRESPWLEKFTFDWALEGSGTEDDPLLGAYITAIGAAGVSSPSLSSPGDLSFNYGSGTRTCVPGSKDVYVNDYTVSTSEIELQMYYSFDGSANADNMPSSSATVFDGVCFTSSGITYKVGTAWLAANMPATLGNWGTY